MTATQTACSNRTLVDRYLLGELPEHQARAFEEHYFDCPVCGEEMPAVDALLDGVQASEERRPDDGDARDGGPRNRGQRRGRSPRIPGEEARWPRRPHHPAVTLALAAATGRGGIISSGRDRRLPGAGSRPTGGGIALRDHPRVLTRTTLRPLTRGPADVTRLTVAPGDRFVTVQLAVRPPLAPSYRARLLDALDRPSATFGELVVPGPRPRRGPPDPIPLAGSPDGLYALEITAEGTGKQTGGRPLSFQFDIPRGLTLRNNARIRRASLFSRRRGGDRRAIPRSPTLPTGPAPAGPGRPRPSCDPRPLPIQGASCALPGTAASAKSPGPATVLRSTGVRTWPRSPGQGPTQGPHRRRYGDYDRGDRPHQLADWGSASPCSGRRAAGSRGPARRPRPVPPLRLRLRLAPIEVFGGTIEVEFHDVGDAADRWSIWACAAGGEARSNGCRDSPAAISSMPSDGTRLPRFTWWPD